MGLSVRSVLGVGVLLVGVIAGCASAVSTGTDPVKHDKCVAKTCAELGYNCGTASDGCGGMLTCGTCTRPQYCGGGGTNVCGGNIGLCDASCCDAPSCTPRTCQQLGLSCGRIDDGCGCPLDCGSCTAPDVCGGGGVPGQCGTPDGGACVPRTCADVGVICGPTHDGCGHKLECQCPGGPFASYCDPSATGGLCTGCVEVCSTCAQVGAECGWAGDGEGEMQFCGHCKAPETCGGGGVANKCGVPSGTCVPKTCFDKGIWCGTADDGCGNTLNCGSCTSPQVCGKNVRGVCG